MGDTTEAKKIILHIEPDQTHHVIEVDALNRVAPAKYTIETITDPDAEASIRRIRNDTEQRIEIIVVSQNIGITEAKKIFEALAQTRKDIIRVFIYSSPGDQKGNVYGLLGKPRIDVELNSVAAGSAITDTIKEYLDSLTNPPTPTPSPQPSQNDNSPPPEPPSDK